MKKDMKRAERRKKNYTKAKRKAKLSQELYRFPWYRDEEGNPILHAFSKNKIHCSCQLCRFRSVSNPNAKTEQDMRNEEKMKQQEEEYKNGEL